MTPAIAMLNRFGLGARTGERRPLSVTEAAATLKQQLSTFSPALPLLRYTGADWRAYMAEHYRRIPRTGQSIEVPAERVGDSWNLGNSLNKEGIRARYAIAIRTEHPFAERLVHFWSNHFSISVNGHGPFHEFESIRPNIMGKFRDLVIAATVHSAGMLEYLTQYQSFGMNSPHGRGRRGMNENLGRELLELHTVSVAAGYTQEDVIEMSKALTGYTVNGWATGVARTDERLGTVHFNPSMHEPGPRTVLGKTYPDTGAQQALNIIDDLCKHPACATFICRKLLVHFIEDEPTEEMVEELSAVWQSSGGDLPTVYCALVDIFFDNWEYAKATRKYRHNWDWSVAVGRYLLSIGVTNMDEVAHGNNGFGMNQSMVWSAPSPAGYTDVKPEVTLVELFWRWQKFQFLFSRMAVRPSAKTMPLDVTDTPPVLEELIRAGRADSGLPNYTTSPEFMWR